MGILNHGLSHGEEAAAAAYTVDSSCRFSGAGNGGTHSYIKRTFGTSTNENTWTVSLWVKRAHLGAEQILLHVGPISGGSDATPLNFTSSDTLAFYDNNDTHPFVTTQVFRDVGSWYHIALAFSTAESGTDKVKLWVNGSQVTSFSTDNRASVTTSGTVNTSGAIHEFGAQSSSATANYGGYLADIYFIDGYAIAPDTNFIETSATTGQIIPKEFSMANYGGNSFHLPFTGGHDSELLINSNHREGSTNFEDSSGAGHNDISTAGDPEHSVRVGNPFTGSDRAIYFDGSGDYLSTPDSGDWAFAGDDFTVEAWIHPTAQPGRQTCLFGQHAGTGNGDPSTAWGFNAGNGAEGQLFFRYTETGTAVVESDEDVFNLNEWSHIAYVRDGNSVYIYVNGTVVKTASMTSSLTDRSMLAYIGYGRSPTDAPSYFTGYIDDFRIVNGSAVYKSFTDLSSNEHAITPNGNVAHTTKTVTDSHRGSVQLDGSGDGLTLSNSNNFNWHSTTEWQIEGWFYPTTAPSGAGTQYPVFFDQAGGWGSWASGGIQWYLSRNNTHIYLDHADGSGSYVSNSWAYGSDFATDTWHHIAIAKDSTSVRVYVDGTLRITASSAGGLLSTQVAAHIGFHSSTATNGFDGYIDDVRVQAASDISGLYAGSSITVPTAPLSTTSNTVFHLQSLGRSFDRPTSKLTEITNTKLLIQADDNDTTVVDRSPLLSRTPHTITATGVSLPATASTPYEAAMKRSAIHLDGNDYLSATASADFSFGTGAYTLEAWVYSPGTGNGFGGAASYGGIVSAYDGSAPYGPILEINDSKWAIHVGDNGSGPAAHSDTGESVATNTWIHVAAVRESTASNKLYFYLNGTKVWTGTDAANYNAATTPARIGELEGSGYTPTGYLYDVRITKGVAKDPSASGYLTNPFVTTKLTHPGGDDSGNKNHFDVEGIGGHDVVGDAPGAGNNYCVLNSLTLTDTNSTGYFHPPASTSSSHGLLEGNTKLVSGGSFYNSHGTMGVSTGTYYFEWYSSGDYTEGGWADTEMFLSNTDPNDGIWALYNRTSSLDIALVDDGVTADWDGDAHASGNSNIYGCAFDIDNRKMYFHKNGDWSDGTGTLTSTFPTSYAGDLTSSDIPADTTFFPVMRAWTSATVIANFGQDPTFNGNRSTAPATSEFAFTPPAGYSSLCTENLPAPGLNNAVSSEKAFEAVTWTGVSSSASDTADVPADFNPDLIWAKLRDDSQQHTIIDSVRGIGATVLDSGTDGGDYTSTAYGVVQNNTTGFEATRGSNGTYSFFNKNGADYVAWLWKAGTSFDAGDGSGTGSKNADAGFSIVKWDGTDWDYDNLFEDPSEKTRTVNHGLGVAPEMIIAKSRSNNAAGFHGTAAGGWVVYHKDLTTGYFITLDDADYEIDPSFGYAYPPIASVDEDTFTVKNADDGTYSYYLNFGDETSGSYYTGDTYVAYCFRSIEGYSKVGSYTGNGVVDGPFVYCGFKPAFILVKRSDDSGGWSILDSARNTYNVADINLSADNNYGDYQHATYSVFTDFLSNGFKIRNSQTGFNSNDYNFIYYAVAESPFKHSAAR